MKLVAVSDLHLDQSTAGVDRFVDILTVVEQAADYAIKHAAEAFLFLGDLADPNTVRAHRAVNAMARIMSKLKRHGITCVCLAGNHDVIEDGGGGTVIDSLHWLDAGPVYTRPQVDVLHGSTGEPFCTIIALPFTATVHSYDPAEFIRSAVVDPHLPILIIGHLNLRGITLGSETTDMPRGRDVFWPIDAIKEAFPTAMLLGGHYHTPQLFDGVRIVGSPVRLRFDERDGQPGFVVLEFAGSEVEDA